MSGTVLWCFRCGVYADKKTKGLKDKCKGKPPRQAHRGGMEGQLRKLRNGTHPKTGASLPMAVELDPVVMLLKVNGNEAAHRPPDGFNVYVPADLTPVTTAAPAEGMSSTDRRKALRDRIRAKERTGGYTQGDVIPDVAPQRSASSGLMETASIGDEVGFETSSGGSQSPDPRTDLVLGGGVWDYLFPDERQHQAREAYVKVNIMCKGKYRIRSKGAACHGRACCRGD